MTAQCLRCPELGDYGRGLCGPCYTWLWRNKQLDPDKYPKKPPRQMGDRRIERDGYVSIKTSDGVMGEHRAVMQQVLGRLLVSGESVHHRNGVRSDNRPENLELWFRQPTGQRVADLIEYLVTFHRDRVEARLES